MIDLSSITGVVGFAVCGGLGLMFGLRSALIVANTTQTVGQVVEALDCSDCSEETAASEEEWLESRLSLENHRRIVEELSIDEIENIYIVECVYNAEVLRVPIVEGPFSREYKEGARATILIDKRDPRKAQFGTLLGHWLTALIGIPFGIFCTTGAVLWGYSLTGW